MQKNKEKDRPKTVFFIYLAAAIADAAAAAATTGRTGRTGSTAPTAIAAEDEEKDQDNDPAAAVTTETIVAHRETSYKVD